MTALTLTSREEKTLQDVDDDFGDMVATLSLWSSQNSGSQNPQGLAAMRALLTSRFSSLGGDLTELALPPHEFVDQYGNVEKKNFEPALQLRVRTDAPVQIVLTGHYDTVFPETSDFQTVKKIDSDTVNGPGTADMKGGILVMHRALSALEEHDCAQNIGYTVLLSPDEEIGSPGSADALANIGRRSHVGLTFEPALADGSMAGARKGSGNFSVTIRGRAAHAGREHHLGRNAIRAAAEFTCALEALSGKKTGVTFNVSKIDGGGAVNIVPELAIVRFNTRMVETEDMLWINEQLSGLMTMLNHKDGISAELRGGFTRPPKPMAPANQMVFDWVKSAGSILGQNIQWNPSGGVCEGNNLWASGCPNVDTLGVRGGDIHSDREFMILSSLVERSRLSALILMKIASGEFDARAAKALVEQSQ